MTDRETVKQRLEAAAADGDEGAAEALRDLAGPLPPAPRSDGGEGQDSRRAPEEGGAARFNRMIREARYGPTPPEPPNYFEGRR